VKKESYRSNAILLLTAFIWGSAFVAQRSSINHIGPYLFNAMRFSLGSISLIPVWLILKKRTDSHPKNNLRATLYYGFLAGAAIFLGASFQQVGLMTTTAGKSGFITGLYVVIVPLINMLWGVYSGFNTWVGAIFSAIGLYFLCMTESLILSTGDFLTLLCAFFFAFHVIMISSFSRKTDPILLSMIQFAVCAILSFIIAIISETIQMESIRRTALAICYCGFISVGIGYTLQVVGQKDANPDHAAIILCLEGVFAAICGWIILYEQMSSRAIFGAALMLSGMIISQIGLNTKVIQLKTYLRQYND